MMAAMETAMAVPMVVRAMEILVASEVIIVAEAPIRKKIVSFRLRRTIFDMVFTKKR